MMILIQQNMTAVAENTIVDPTVMSEVLKQGISTVNNTAQHESLSVPSNSTQNASQLADPTIINQNFREALTRANQLKAAIPDVTNSLGKSASDSNNVKVSLVANVHNKNQEKNKAILRVNDKSEMVSTGDTITYFQGGELMHIDVIEITKNYVKVTLMPLNQTLILR